MAQNFLIPVKSFFERLFKKYLVEPATGKEAWLFQFSIHKYIFVRSYSPEEKRLLQESILELRKFYPKLSQPIGSFTTLFQVLRSEPLWNNKVGQTYRKLIETSFQKCLTSPVSIRELIISFNQLVRVLEQKPLPRNEVTYILESYTTYFENWCRVNGSLFIFPDYLRVIYQSLNEVAYKCGVPNQIIYDYMYYLESSFRPPLEPITSSYQFFLYFFNGFHQFVGMHQQDDPQFLTLNEELNVHMDVFLISFPYAIKTIVANAMATFTMEKLFNSLRALTATLWRNQKLKKKEVHRLIFHFSQVFDVVWKRNPVSFENIETLCKALTACYSGDITYFINQGFCRKRLEDLLKFKFFVLHPIS